MKALVVLCALAGAAHAQTLRYDTSKVEALFEEGNKHYDLGEYDQAVAAFRKAYALLPDPSFLFNIGQSYRLGHRCREATAAYRAYLRNAPASGTTDDRAKIEQLIRDLEPCTKTEEERLRRLAPPPELSPRHKKLRIAGLATAAVGTVALGGGVAFSVRAARAANELERACGGEQPTCGAAEAVEIDTRGRAASRDAMWLYIAGGATVAVGTTLVLYTVLRPEHVMVAPTNDGLFITAAGKF